ncbi:MAG: hypothetical protein P8I86_11535 [Luminiphilus sp.]|nr:hypothetical protein [Luminiphilus sp.]MDG2037976.1 hypothetical protein [Luminiphilus sp.]
MKVKRMVGGLSAGVIVALAMTSMTVFAETAKLRVSIEGGAFNSKFKFFDASEGCPGYNDIPGAKAYLGSIFASDKGADKDLAVGKPVQVFLFRPKETFSISAAGGEKEIRRRSLQVVLKGDATLRYTGFDDKIPAWEATGEIEVEPAAACENAEDPETNEDASSDEPEA